MIPSLPDYSFLCIDSVYVSLKGLEGIEGRKGLKGLKGRMYVSSRKTLAIVTPNANRGVRTEEHLKPSHDSRIGSDE